MRNTGQIWNRLDWEKKKVIKLCLLFTVIPDYRIRNSVDFHYTVTKGLVQATDCQALVI